LQQNEKFPMKQYRTRPSVVTALKLTASASSQPLKHAFNVISIQKSSSFLFENSLVSITKAKWLRYLGAIIAVYFEDQKKNKNTPFKMQEFLDVEVAGTHSYHSALRGLNISRDFPKHVNVAIQNCCCRQFEVCGRSGRLNVSLC
jgi:hypothetical protein